MASRGEYALPYIGIIYVGVFGIFLLSYSLRQRSHLTKIMLKNSRLLPTAFHAIGGHKYA